MPQRYHADPDRIVAEELPGEVMVVDLDTGFYYVLTGSAAAAWPLLARGETVDDTAGVLADVYDASAGEIGATLGSFVAQLVDEGLLAATEAGPHAGIAAAPPAPTSPADGPLRFDEPTMTKYVDMANLVQMDPIRDFEQRRWPSKFRFRRRTDGARADDA